MNATQRWIALLGLGLTSCSSAAVFNLKVVTDASPDYSDLPSLVRIKEADPDFFNKLVCSQN